MIAVLFSSLALYSQTDNPKALEFYNSGCNKISGKNYTDAISDFSEALKLDRGFIQAYENRGVAKYYLKNYTGAIDDYSRALEINPDDFNTFGRRGWAKFYLQDFKGAIADFTKALIGPRNRTLYFNIRGEAEYLLKEYKVAINDFSRVIKSGSSDNYQRRKAFYWRGLARFETGENDAGCLDLKKAVELGYTEASDSLRKYCK